MTAVPGVTVIIPCFNGAHFVGAAIESALAQGPGCSEVLVVDDGSTDSSLDIIRSYGDRIAWYSFENAGPAAARNRGLRRVRTSHCLFLDADDLLECGFIAALAAAAMTDDWDLVFGQSRMIWPDGHFVEKDPVPPGVTTDHALSMVLSAGWMPPNAILWKSDFILEIGGWNEQLRRNEDGELIARALLNHPRFTSTFGCRAIYRQHNLTNRVSGRRDDGALRSNLSIGQSISKRIGRDPEYPMSQCALGRSMSELAREAYDSDYEDIGSAAEKLARSLGCRAQFGSWPHRAFSKLLGLRLKTRLAKRMKRPG